MNVYINKNENDNKFSEIKVNTTERINEKRNRKIM